MPDCELTNFDANGECGAISNNNFGQSNPGAVQYADDMISGFGTRDNFWDFSAEVQHELAPGVSFTGGYYRNWSSFFGSAIDAGYFSPGDWRTASVNDNLSVGPEDFDPFCITAPMDPGLPGGGGYEVCGLYDITPEKFGVGEVLVSKPSNFGDGQHRTSDFFTFSLNSQFGNGTVLGGSLDTGRIVEDNCFVVDSPQKLLHCRVTTAVQEPDPSQAAREPCVARRFHRQRHLQEHPGSLLQRKLQRAQRRDRTVAGPQPGGLRKPDGVYRLCLGAAHCSPDRLRAPANGTRSAADQSVRVQRRGSPASEYRRVQRDEQ